MYKFMVNETLCSSTYDTLEEVETAAFDWMIKEKVKETKIIEVIGTTYLKPCISYFKPQATEDIIQASLDNFNLKPEPETKTKAKKSTKKLDKIEPLDGFTAKESEEIMSNVINHFNNKKELETLETDEKKENEVIEQKEPEFFAVEQLKNLENKPVVQVIESNNQEAVAKKAIESVTTAVKYQASEKVYPTSLGITINESALKASCRNKFINGLESGKTAENLQAIVRNLISIYPDVDKEEWFKQMVNDQLKSFTQDEDNKYCESLKVKSDGSIENKNELDLLSVALSDLEKVTNASQLAELSKKYLDLKDQKYLDAFYKKVDEFNEKLFKEYLLELSNCKTELAINVLKESNGYAGLQYTNLEKEFILKTELKLYEIRTNIDINEKLTELETRLLKCNFESDVYPIEREKEYQVFKKVSEVVFNYKEEIIQNAIKEIKIKRLVSEIEAGNTTTISNLQNESKEIQENSRIKLALQKSKGIKF